MNSKITRISNLGTVESVEQYSPERKAEFILSNATDLTDYAVARRKVEAMGLNPDEISHHKLE